MRFLMKFFTQNRWAAVALGIVTFVAFASGAAWMSLS